MIASIPRVNVLGVQVSTLGFSQTIDLIADTIASNGRLAISPSPVYTILQGYERLDVRRALNQNLATPDGMPVVWVLRHLGYRADRVYGPDIMQAVCERSIQAEWGHYFYGGAEGVAGALAESFQQKYKGLRVCGVESPPFTPLAAEEDKAMVARLNASGAQVVWVGLGSPKQDLWMAEHRARLEAPVLIGVGAAFDFFAGSQKQAPRWMQRSGLEWLFRLMTEPRRLWRRYLIGNPKFAAAVVMQLTRLRRFDA